jgi:NAD(P)-dependent dehydrogenase (short-subunit alcohol dehydrogenase family)
MILVTGGSGGIGRACAVELLARTDAEVLITGRSAERLDAVRDQVSGGQRNRLRSLVSDQAKLADVESLVAMIGGAIELEGAILTVGANPLYTEGPRKLHAVAIDTVETTIRTNCSHAFLLSGAILERLRRRGGGTLIWIGSRAAGVGAPGAALYCATKAFLGGMARAARCEYNARGVRVHVAHPGLVRTARTASVAERLAARHGLIVEEPAVVARRVVELLLTDGGEPTEVEL